MKVCAKCSKELKVERNGVTVIEHVRDLGPYRIWQADLFKCPNCGNETILNFADKAVEQWHAEFESTLEKAEKNPFLYNVYAV